MGVNEQLIFPEIDYDKVDRMRGMDITFVTTAKTDEECQGPARGASVSRSSDRSVHPVTAEVAVSKEDAVAKKSMIAKAKRKPKFGGARSQPLQPLRTAARVLPAVRPVPHLPARARQPWRASRRAQGELVGSYRTFGEPAPAGARATGAREPRGGTSRTIGGYT